MTAPAQAIAATPLVPRSPEWLEARAAGITSTDIPILLGLSPYTAEATLAREKAGEVQKPDADRERVMRIGLAIEDVTRREYEAETGRKLRRVNRLLYHPDIPWAMTSLDFVTVGERRIVEAKASRSARWSDELPQDVEAQVRWQLGVTGYPVADVAALLHGSELRLYEVEHDQPTFDRLVLIATDFRRRLAEGGPFAENAASVKARYPQDDGSELKADEEIEEAVERLLTLRDKRTEFEAAADLIETAIKARMGEASRLAGRSWHITWRRTKDVETTDWRSIADGLLRQLPDEERQSLIGIHTMVRAGFRPFRVVVGKGDSA